MCKRLIIYWTNWEFASIEHLYSILSFTHLPPVWSLQTSFHLHLVVVAQDLHQSAKCKVFKYIKYRALDQNITLVKVIRLEIEIYWPLCCLSLQVIGWLDYQEVFQYILFLAVKHTGSISLASRLGAVLCFENC